MAAFSQRTAALPYGIEISYADSGPVPGSTDYTTVILIHGSAFNGHGFEKLHRLAWKRNMRTVALQRREYPGSTRYTDIELDDLRNGRKAFTDGLAHLVASFVHYFVETQDIPQMSADGRSGGVAIVGWSLGTVTAMSLFADPEVIPSDLYTVLERYIKDLILYDPPYISFGYDLPPDSRVHNPWPKPSNGQTTEDLYRSFETWVSSYYNVPINWSGDINALDHRPRGDVATVDSWTYDQRARYFTMEAALRSEYAM
ncbi:hypothetical protein B0H34DRAFT_653831 [Crassisporium funariophilum]|nr:hypothetical protein B0H34DRAFT_653831 [Crassisporium funariophilum]